MTQWYYADAQRQRQGPVDTDTLRARLEQGVIDRSSLVWREGLAQWVTLAEVAAELGLETPAATRETASALTPAPVTADPSPGAATSADPVPEAGFTPVTPQTTQPDSVPAAHISTPVDAGSVTSSAPSPGAWSATTAAESTEHQPATTASPATPAQATPLPAAWDMPATSLGVAPVADAPIVYAGLWRRVAASVLDSFITTFAVYLIVIPVVLVLSIGLGASSSASSLEGASGTVAIMILAYGIGLLIPTIYFAWMQSSRHQASLGKLACGIKLVNGNGGRVSFWRNMLRYLAYMLITVLTLGIGAIVSAFMAGMSARKQAIHDKVCDTLVVDRWAYTDTPERQQVSLDTVTIVVLAIYAVMLLISIVFGVLFAVIAINQS
ncbi:RDD family protein [Xanthomonas campestris]|uniref:RDD family protein n=1 Tax=Xanthomonas campestris TaxID=339 RepID=UPI001E28C42A|nr:RDD family protein [Xanthomonas campestris]MCC5073796.1 RDD family protein [Xanthomonas campestris pv. plantaginis]